MTNRFFSAGRAIRFRHRVAGDTLVKICAPVWPITIVRAESTCWVTLSRRHDNRLSLWSNSAASVLYRQRRYSDRAVGALFARFINDRGSCKSVASDARSSSLNVPFSLERFFPARFDRRRHLTDALSSSDTFWVANVRAGAYWLLFCACA